VEPLLGLPHNGRTHARASVNAEAVSRRLEGGTAAVPARLAGLRKLALAGYPIGLVVAPIMPVEGWREGYATLFDEVERALGAPDDLTFELITHRFTPSSKEMLEAWYPNSGLEMNKATRDAKRNKFGGFKYVYPKAVMRELRTFFETEIALRFPEARILYWT
jgi:spore photoproduct lyase